MLLMYVHMAKMLGTRQAGLSKVGTLLLGTSIFLMSLGACFTGYVLVCGQMSYWALTVILNLATVFPGVGGLLVSSFLAGSSTCDLSIRRVFTAH
jgi:quinol-cytochrome oxidoreductase complex cytochrome b subunit